MTDEQHFKTLLQKIVDNHYPEETLVFELFGDAMVEDLFSNEWSGHRDGHADKHGLADLATAKLAVEIASLVATTFKTFAEVRALMKKKKIQLDPMKIQEEWERKLKLEGIKSSKAKEIAKQFAQEMASLCSP